MTAEAMHYDIVIVGAGPAGLAAAIALKQRAPDLSVAMVEKSAEIGGHILSGAVIDPIGLDTLIPDWRDKNTPVSVAVTKERMLYLTHRHAIRLPVPPFSKNDGNYIISLGELCRWLARQAEEMGVEIYAGFAASQLLFDGKGAVTGILTGVMGIGKDGKPTSHYQEGVRLLAKQTILAEGARGSLTKELLRQFDLTKNCQEQTYGIGIKELWTLTPDKHDKGCVIHTIGWPLDRATYGGSFLYHGADNQLACGFVIGLDYQNPYLSPFEEFQRFKTHPAIRPLFKGARRIAYGARALTEGGWQSLPKLSFDGGLIIGCAAGMVNVPRIKGSHNAIMSGIIAAECIIRAAKNNKLKNEITEFDTALRQSSVGMELKKVRNVRPFFQYGLLAGILHAGVEGYLLRGRAPWTFKHHAPDHQCLQTTKKARKINYPKADGILTFDRLSSVYLANVAHAENQPAHLTLKDDTIPISHNLTLYDAPEQRYCPAAVYEIVKNEEGRAQLHINAQNCIHCKTCDIKDPKQNINWVTPEGGGGPNYPNM